MVVSKLFIRIPLKKTKTSSILQEIKYLLLSCPNLDVSEYVPGLEKLDCLRCQLSEICVSADSLEFLYRYHDLLYSFLRAVPKEIVTKKLNHIVWKPAFPDKTWKISDALTKSTSLEYELCAVLFCIGAVQTSLASSADFSSQEELKNSTKLFQRSAGIFEMLSDVTEGRLGKRITEDMSPSFLSALSAVALHQAHCCIIEKAGTASSYDLLAKLYSEGVKLSKTALELCTFSKMPDEWLHSLSQTYMYFNAQSNYCQSFADESKGSYGLRLMRLKTAVSLSSSCKLVDQSVYKGLLSKATKENDLIYHDALPTNIPGIPSASIVKTIPPVFPLSSIENPFADITSPAVSVARSKLRDLWDQFVACSMSGLHKRSNQLDETLKKYYLPAVLEDTNASIPQCVLKMSADVQSYERDCQIDDIINRLVFNHNHSVTLVSQSSDSLTQERTYDDKQRSIYRNYWTRMSSVNLTSSFWSQLKTLENKITISHKADAEISELYEQCRGAVQILRRSAREIESQIPSMSTITLSTDGPNMARLRVLVEDVDGQKKTVELMKEVLTNADFGPHVDRFKERDRRSEDLRVDDEFELFKYSFSSQVDSIAQSFGNLVAEIENICGSNGLGVNSSGASVTSSREEFITYLTSGYKVFEKMTFHIKEGLAFYVTFINFLERLNSNIQDYCYTRSIEAQDLMTSLKNLNVSKNNLPYPQ